MLYTFTLNENRIFLSLYKKGRFIASKYSVVYLRPNGKSYNRFGITAGKKIGNAVCRNRAKRLIRLAYRNAEARLPVGMDIVIVARPGILGIKSTEYSNYFEKYCVRDIEKNFRRLSENSRSSPRRN
ncbi:MAG: ribonuclease P protein component [Alistipes sp.]|nr:ribonuclease P protein component [Alistipes sp.]